MISKNSTSHSWFHLRYDHAKPATTCSKLLQLAAANSCVSQVWKKRCPKTLWCHMIQVRIICLFGVSHQLSFGSWTKIMMRITLVSSFPALIAFAGPLPLAKRRPKRWCSFTLGWIRLWGTRWKEQYSSMACDPSSTMMPFQKNALAGDFVQLLLVWRNGAPTWQMVHKRMTMWSLIWILFPFLKLIRSHKWALSTQGIPDNSLCSQVSNYRIIYLPADLSPMKSWEKIILYIFAPTISSNFATLRLCCSCSVWSPTSKEEAVLSENPWTIRMHSTSTRFVEFTIISRPLSEPNVPNLNGHLCRVSWMMLSTNSS